MNVKEMTKSQRDKFKTDIGSNIRMLENAEYSNIHGKAKALTDSKKAQLEIFLKQP